MNYKLRQSNRRTLAIRVADGDVTVYAPYGVSKAAIDQFVSKKEAWIKKRLQMYRKPGIDLDFDKVVMIFGHRCQIRRFEAKEFHINLSAETIDIYAPVKISTNRLLQLVEGELKNRLDDLIQSVLAEVCHELKLPIPPYIIRKYKRLYGRCSQHGSLGFNTYLYHESETFIRYVVIHECAHLIEFNHSPRFYAIIEAVMPNYKAVLNQHKQLRLLDQDQ